MNTHTHTPGPWYVDPGYVDKRTNAYVRFKAGGMSPAICRMVRLPQYHDSQANARLIAAAPELLEALVGLLTWCETRCPTLIESDSAWGKACLNRAIEAITKAKGEV